MSYLERMPKTSYYLRLLAETGESRKRIGEHIYVIEREMCNLATPFDELNDIGRSKFDKRVRDYLMHLDAPQ